jgi:hypothetical protein
MDFIHPYLLAGLALAGLPVLLHLIMRQRPRLLPFPAFRFLRQRHLSNRRKLRLQNLLLLLVRMLVIAALCLALARPRLTADPLPTGDTRAVTAVLLFDTSPSMEYTSAGQTRLDDARLRARELLDEMAEGSQVALLDSGDELTAEGEQWLSSAVARSRLDALHIRPAAGPLNPHIDRALRLLQKAGEAEDAPPRFLYIISDRTRACWDGRSARVNRPENVAIVFVDVGIDTPHDLAIDKVEVVPPVVPPGETVRIQVSVRATGAAVDTELTCQLDNEPQKDQPPDMQVVKLEPGQSRLYVFERTAPRPAPGSNEHTYPLTVRLASSDALAFNNTRYATFQTRPRRSVLTLVDSSTPVKKVGPWTPWQLSIEEVKAFSCEVKSLQEAEQLDAKQLAAYPAVCLFQAAPSAALWSKLAAHVARGGGLVIVPGGQEIAAADFNRSGAALLPSRLEKVVEVSAEKPAIPWSPWKGQHPITAFFLETIRTNANVDFADPATQPAVNAYWDVKPQDKDASVLATFATPGTPPALLERIVGKGHVLMLTTPLDARFLEGTRRWHNYWQGGSFGLVLVDRICRYLAGDESHPELSFLCGQQVQVALQPPLDTPPYTLQGPGLSLAESSLEVPAGETQLPLPQAVTPGNFSILDGKNRLVAGCSVNIRPEESLLERVPAEEIEAALGPKSVLQVGRALTLEDALQGLHAPPLELLPWLMIATLLVLAGESLLANYFNRRKGASATDAPAAAERAPA